MKKFITSLIVLAMMVWGLVSLAAAQRPIVLAVNPEQNILEVIKQRRGMTREEFEAKRIELKNLMEQKRTEWRNQVEAKREELKSQIEGKRIDLRTRLAKIKDERKKQIVERVYSQVNELNKRSTNHFLDVLEKLERILERISSRAAKAEVNGYDISVVKSAITNAANLIAASRIVVQNQVTKIYSPVINTEDTLKTDVGKIRQALHNDLMAVRKTVKDVQEAVRKAATTLAQIPKIDELEVGTTTQSTP